MTIIIVMVAVAYLAVGFAAAMCYMRYSGILEAPPDDDYLSIGIIVVLITTMWPLFTLCMVCWLLGRFTLWFQRKGDR